MRERAYLAAPITAVDTAEALVMAAESAAGGATLVEYRLDLMANFDLPRLLASSPLPAIVTCRPAAQGGRFDGSEAERLAILRRAIAGEAAFVDAEADILPRIGGHPRPRTQLIGSHHNFGAMLRDWEGRGRQLAAAGADVIKLAGMATSSDDALPPLKWLAGLVQPGIGIAMGEQGLATRLLAPRFGACLLSFAALGAGTAPGQIGLAEMVESFGYHQLAGANPLFVLLTPPAVPWQLVRACRQALADAALGPAPWLLPIPTATFGPGLLAACQLARSDGILCLAGVERDPRLAHRHRWGRIPEAVLAAAGPWLADDEPQGLKHEA
jgi:3-dehydroquinate dehydratase/shikimate dehydrogenase